MYTTYFAIQRESSFYLGEKSPPPKKTPQKISQKKTKKPNSMNQKKPINPLYSFPVRQHIYMYTSAIISRVW